MTVDLAREHYDGMKLEHVKIGRDYMWGDRRVTVRGTLDGRRQGDPDEDDSESHTHTNDPRDRVTVLVNDEWEWVPSEALQPLSARCWLEDMRANYAHKCVPDLPTPITCVYQRWDDVPCGALVVGQGDTSDMDILSNERCLHKYENGSWCWVYTSKHGLKWAANDADGVEDANGPWRLVARVFDDVEHDTAKAMFLASVCK